MIKAIEISSYGSIQDTIRVPLGQVTLLHGSNGSGKTVICRAIATALTSESPLPLQPLTEAFSKAKVGIEFTHPTLGNLKLEREFSLAKVAPEKEISFDQDEVRVDGKIRPDISILPGLVNFAYLSSYHDPYSVGFGDLPEHRFLQVAARFLGFVDASSDAARKAVFEILRRVNQRQDRAFRKIEVRDDRLYFQHWDKDPVFPYGTSGTGDKGHLLSDFLLEAAALLGQYRHVLLILDDFPTKLVSERFARRYRQLSSPNIQVIMTTVREGVEDTLGADQVVELQEPRDGDNSTGIRGSRLIPRPMSTTIEQVIESYKSGMEAEFIEEFVAPALRALDFKQVSRVPLHGVGEHGFDIQLFHRAVFPGRVAYFGAQVKAGNVGSKSSGSGTVSELIDQLKKMLTFKGVDPATQLRTSADYALAIISGRLSPDAQRIFDDAFEADRRIVLWDAQRFASVLYEAGVWPIILSSLDRKRLQQEKDSEEN